MKSKNVSNYDTFKVISWDLDKTLINNGHAEELTKDALESLCNGGFINIVTTASPKDYAYKELSQRGLNKYINKIYGELLSGEGKSYFSVAVDIGLKNEECFSNLIIVGDSLGDIPVDLIAVFVLSKNPQKVAKVIRELDKNNNFIEGYFGEIKGFRKAHYSRLKDEKKIPVLIDDSLSIKIE